MRQRLIIIAIIIFSVISIIFLNAGINGLVISQSCCFGSQCAAENVCPVARTLPGYSNIYPELFIGLVSIAMIYGVQFLKE